MGKYHGGRGQGERDWVRDGGEGKAGGASGQDGPAKGSSGGACTITLRVSCPLGKKNAQHKCGEGSFTRRTKLRTTA